MKYTVVAKVKCSNKADEMAIRTQLDAAGKTPPDRKKGAQHWDLQGQIAAEKMAARVMQLMKNPRGRPRPGEPRASLISWSVEVVATAERSGTC